MIKKISISVCLLFSLFSFAQDGTASPYSFYGIGDIRFKGTTESRSMAGVSVEPDSIHLNLQNPAGYANLKFVTLSLGGGYNTSTLKTDAKSANTKRSTMDYLAVALPIGKFGVGLGLMPYSSVGYKIESAATATQNYKRFSGTGGLNKVFFGLGYKISSKWSVGADFQYNFGKIETTGFEQITDIKVGSRELNTSILSGINSNLGTMYQTKINKKTSFYTSFTFTPEASLLSKNTRNIDLNLAAVDPLKDVTNKIRLTSPSKFTIGAGIGETKKWLLGAEIALKSQGSLSNNYNNVSNVSYEKGTKFSLGGYYIPNYTSFSSYAKRITYRGGLKFEKTGLVVNSQSINDLGLTLGVGLPIMASNSFSNVNFGFELGKRGTTSAGLVKENYANFIISFSLNDKWFVKAKYY